MRLNKIEENIAEKMNEYPSPLDTDSLWNDLESDLDKEKKRRIGILLFTFFSILAIGSLIIYQFQTAQNQVVTTEATATESITSSTKEFAPATENASKNKIDNKEDVENKNKNTSLNADAKINAGTEQLQIQNTKQADQTTNEGNKKTADQAINSFNKSIALNDQTNLIKINPELISANNLTQINKVENIDGITFLNLTKIDFFKKENDLTVNKNSKKIIPVKNWSLYISPTFGAYYTDRKIAQSNIDGAVLKDNRNSSEKTLETLSLGIGIELKNKNNFFLSGGINFNQITERFNDRSSDFIMETIEVVKEINYLPNGDIQEVNGEFDQSQEIISITKTYNTLRWTEFNVGGGYYFTKKRCDIGVSGGLLLGTMLNAEGKILNTENNIIEIENSDIYKNNLGIGAFANLEVRYTLQPRLRLSAQLGYKHLPGSFTNEDYPLEIKYQWLGAAVGLHYKLY